MTVGTSFNSNLSRDELIKSAYRAVKAISIDANLNTDQLSNGVQLLNLIMRQLDGQGKHLWALSQSPVTLSLTAQVWTYDSSSGLATNILKLETAVFRNLSGEDTPLEIVSTKGYEAIQNKIDAGTPQKIYLTEHRDIGSQKLYIWPAPLTIETQSEVTGTDANNYRCIKSHSADSTNKPITGANYLLFWELGGSSGSAWASGTSYKNPQLIRYTHTRPLWDFDLSTDNPDIPAPWFRRLKYLLAYDLSDEINADIEIRNLMKRKSNEAFDDTQYEVEVPRTNSFHDKGLYF